MTVHDVPSSSVYVSKTPAELEKLAQDIVGGRVFGSWDIDDLGMVRMVFLPLAFVDKDFSDRMKAANIVHIYEYVDKAGPRSVNGMPIFMSMNLLDETDAKDLHGRVDALAKFLDERRQAAS